MVSSFTRRDFFHSRSVQGLALYLVFCLLLATGVAIGFYSASMSWFTEHKSDEKTTALKLVDAFVQNYSEIRAKIGPDAPVPATFRAHSIELFNGGESGDFRLRWVGRTGRAIVTPPADPAMSATIEGFAGMTNPQARSEFLTVDGMLVFRTTYPSFAQQKSCVDCHNQIQPNQNWKLGDLMGAFSIDVPAGPFIAQSRMQAAGLGAALFIVLAALGAFVAMLHIRQNREREAAQRSLADSEGRFRDYAASASDWFWEQDEELRFTYTSAGAPDKEPVIGKTRSEIVTAQGLSVPADQLQGHAADLAARRPFSNFRYQRMMPGGDVRYMSISGRPVFDREGRFKGYRGTGRDVTAEVAIELELGLRVEERTAELRRAQTELVRREKLSTLGQLTATVAHELRNPLSAIRNTVFTVREMVLAKGLDLERPLSRVDRNIQRCDRIITDLLDFTRTRELNRAELEADPWLEDVLADQRLPALVTLVRGFDAAGLRVSLDAERMRRVVINLIDNAAQAMPENVPGTITVRTRADGGMFELTVEDTGAGIAQDVLSKVFEPLYSTKSFGTGLGLPTVKQIVEQHGGTVGIASEVRAGTRVTVRLPSLAAQEMAA
jgi:PAS domain S-box-containing protein